MQQNIMHAAATTHEGKTEQLMVCRVQAPDTRLSTRQSNQKIYHCCDNENLQTPQIYVSMSQIQK